MNNINLNELMNVQSAKGLAAYLAAVLASVVLAYLFNLIYQFYFSSGNRGVGVHRSFPLIAPAVTVIFLVVQFSLPLSLGLLGALSFVRFRTPVKEPEEIGFILLLIGSSLACAVFRFDVGIILLLLTAAVALVHNRFSLFRKSGANGDCELFVVAGEGDKQADLAEVITRKLSGSGLRGALLSVSSAEGLTSLHFRVQGDGRGLMTGLSRDIGRLEAVSKVSVIYNDAPR